MKLKQLVLVILAGFLAQQPVLSCTQLTSTSCGQTTMSGYCWLVRYTCVAVSPDTYNTGQPGWQKCGESGFTPVVSRTYHCVYSCTLHCTGYDNVLSSDFPGTHYEPDDNATSCTTCGG